MATHSKKAKRSKAPPSERQQPSGSQQVLDVAREHHAAGRLAQAGHLYRKILAVRPNEPVVMHLLGVVAHQMGQNDAAVDLITKALALKPDYAEAHYNLGNVFHALKRHEEAAASYEQALALKPDYVLAHYNLGHTFHALRRLEEAADCYQRALALKPDHVLAHYNLGNVFHALKRHEEAVACYEQVLALKPDYPEAHYDLGDTLKGMGRLEEAADCYQQALALKPDYAEAYHNLGNTLKGLGRLDDALVSYQKGIAIHPDCAFLYSAMIYTLCQTAEDGGAKVFGMCKKFGERFEATLPRMRHPNDPVPGRRLRIGYVSGDFRQHSVAFFIEPVLANHDRQAVEVFCYYNHQTIDTVTKRMMGYPDHWRSIHGMADDDVARRIRQDEIDILVDLGGHTAYNRLLVFARKPAPVQVTWIGYPATSGLTAMDYRLTNQYMDPIGWNEQYHTETLVRLSASACFQPEKDLPPINALPALKNGHVTFASFHDPNKITPTTIALWARVLAALPNSRLLLCPDTARDRTTKQFLDCGIHAERLAFAVRRPVIQYLALHHEADILLDTFPYNGSTITRNALWMGVPVLTLAGRAPVSRAGLSILSQVGLESFAAESEEQYVRLALRWVNDLDGLAQVRSTLRKKMQEAPFSNAQLMTRNLEAAYRQMWGTWCERQKSRS